MSTKNQLRLHTERLVLRELADSDFDAVHAYASDPLVVRFMPWGPNSESDTAEFLTRAQLDAQSQPRLGYELAVTLSDGGALLGAMGLHREKAEAPEAMLGYCFAQEAWGHGYATEASRAMIRFGFETLQLDNIWAGCNAANVGSIRVLEKVGLTLQSRHRDDNASTEISTESLMFRLDRGDFAP